MKIYRALKDLSTGQRKGDLVDGNDFRGLNILVAKGALARASSPPLTELPGWQMRAKKLRKIGIVTIEDLLGMDPREGTRIFRHKRKSTFLKWIEIAKCWLLAPRTRGDCGCK